MTNGYMKSMVLTAPAPVASAPLQQATLPIPEPGPDQIRIRLRACGVCHTDLHTVEGELELPRLPVTPGHQLVGTVDKIGVQSERFAQGDRVGVAWLNWACGVCEYCASEFENLCPDARFTGLHADGGYAQYAVVDDRFAYALPQSFSDTQAAPLLCAGIVGYRSLRLSGVEPGGRLGLYGFGASAHLVIQAARHWGCDVYVFTRNADHRHHAEELGAQWVGGAEERPPVLLDAGITFAPAGPVVPLALAHLRPGGTLALNAIHMSPIPEMDYDLIYGERVLRSVANFTRRDAEEFLSLAAEIPIRTDVEVYGLSEANSVLRRLKESRIRGAAVLEIP